MNQEGQNIFDRISNQFSQQLEKLDTQQNDFWFVQSEQDERISAFRLRDKLLRQFEGFTIDEVFAGQNVKNQYGTCYVIGTQENFSFHLLPLDKARQRLYTDLTLVPGIRWKRQKQLKLAGYNNLFDLTDHSQYGSEARKVLQQIEQQDLNSFVEFIHQRYRSWSEITMLYVSAFLKPSDFLFFDIETLGIYGVLVILIGVGYFTDKGFTVKQFLVLDPDQEAGALYEFVKLAQRFKALVSFNGRSFDINFLLHRLAYNSIYVDLDLIHFDVYLFAKRIWKDKGVENFKLKTLENFFLGVQRTDDIPSDLVPEFYITYSETGNIGPLLPIIIHNQLDIISIAKLFNLMHKQLSDGSAGFGDFTD